MESDQPTFRILVIDDDEDDFIIARELLSEADGATFQLEWEANYEAAVEAICRNHHDVYLLDYRLGSRDGLQLLREALARGCRAPVILITGHGDHAVDVEATAAGAMDYLVKGRIDATLLERSIRYAIARHRAEQEKEALISELEQALAEITTLEGLLPICASCKSIRDDKGYWNKLETYISDHSNAEFSHSVCPDCFNRLYPEQQSQIVIGRHEAES